MKVYISDKEKDFLDACLSETGCYEFIETETDFEEELDIKTIEQHNKELLKEFAESLYNELPRVMIPATYLNNITKEMDMSNVVLLLDIPKIVKKLLKERGVE